MAVAETKASRILPASQLAISVIMSSKTDLSKVSIDLDPPTDFPYVAQCIPPMPIGHQLRVQGDHILSPADRPSSAY
jgi:hypothetical protein